MKVEVRRPTRAEREPIRRMMELYLHDLSGYNGDDLDVHALYGYGDLDYYWFEPTHAAFVIAVDEKWGGFALVDDEVIVEGNERSMCEFFVARKYRRKGVGATAAAWIFREMPARWEVRVMASNLPAQRFWRAMLPTVAGDRLSEVTQEGDGWWGPIFSFDNRGG